MWTGSSGGRAAEWYSENGWTVSTFFYIFAIGIAGYLYKTAHYRGDNVCMTRFLSL